jgi:octaprenyl-diphosphate synthase
MDLEKIFVPVRAELEEVEIELAGQLTQISEKAHSHYRGFVKKAVSHLFAVSGKRLRPALLLLSAKAAGAMKLDAMPRAVIEMASAVELVHSASLIHDDIIDESTERRDRSSLNYEFGNKIAVLVGDLLYSQFFYRLTSLSTDSWQPKQQIFDIFWNTTEKMCVGEILQQRILQGMEPADKERYLDILENKTALLMAASCKCGGVLTEADQEVQQLLWDFGLSFGMAYQLVDDYLDRDTLYRDGTMDELHMAKEYITQGKSLLARLPDTPAASSLDKLCDYLVSRVDKRVGTAG